MHHIGPFRKEWIEKGRLSLDLHHLFLATLITFFILARSQDGRLLLSVIFQAFGLENFILFLVDL